MIHLLRLCMHHSVSECPSSPIGERAWHLYSVKPLHGKSSDMPPGVRPPSRKAPRAVARPESGSLALQLGAQIVLSGIQLVLAGIGIGVLMAAPIGLVNILCI